MERKKTQKKTHLHSHERATLPIAVNVENEESWDEFLIHLRTSAHMHMIKFFRDVRAMVAYATHASHFGSSGAYHCFRNGHPDRLSSSTNTHTHTHTHTYE